MDFLDPQQMFYLVMVAPVLLLSLTVHEFAHARTALAFGDPTARAMGRVSLNPLVHLDPIGTLVLLVTQRIGWAKPVPVNPLNLQPRRLGDIMVSLAGPMSNLLLAILAGVLLRVVTHFEADLGEKAATTLLTILWITMSCNVGLCVFNLIPLFPLDGHHIAREMLPPDRHADFMRWQLKYGRLILLALILLPMAVQNVGQIRVISPIRLVHGSLMGLLQRLLGLPPL